ncbi:BirA family biotin operon repressor/biotin-[acetyl-CoA-carboxylase] ligase [Algoriphagus ratkowskyi]|uniref:Biotin--[acetyl-CoA-carboxylase] ligase n=1 Tax=Algoriphagus ratkowskyi TaxID=57028 RepID=A0A2W7RXF0_9BACT|nr:biotin--[acetyl-CoA-carboxylase] ligase [Algoriphagus ratkowskyi]PZX59269.1 BirA family biotin operon repressor/biotin-[acetyl-CoA-carboxylase] ligase [Algoriphagus ratkowskyi]TXD77456.1 biotin--[acetyl-CoA-carboxylase] ligase [Algoriphagus ratkowskyi]
MYKILANTIFFGKDVHFLSECHSTNDIALNLVRQFQVGEGSIVICDNQTKGKGQRGNFWQSEAGQNLTFSLVLRPDFLDISEQFYLNMTVSNSLRRLLQDYVPQLEVKWPNDLIVPGYGKMGGILIENTFSGKEWEFAVVGIGLNINQLSFDSETAVSLKSITGSQFELEELFRLLITQLEQGYIQLKKGKLQEIKSEYLMNLHRRDSWSKYSANEEQFSGKIVGISAGGKLEIELKDGEIEVFDLKEISFL